MQQLLMLEKLISKAFSFHKNTHETFQVKAFCLLLNHALEEARQIKTTMLDAAFQNSCNKQMGILVRNCQAVCVALCNSIYEGTKHLKQLNYNAASITVMLQKQALIQECVLDLLYFMENYFSRYFDTSQKVPHQYAALRIAALKQQSYELQQALSPLMQPNAMQALLHPVNQFLSSQNIQPTYASIDFFTAYIGGLLNACDNKTTEDLNAAIISKCVVLDYCPPLFISHFIETLRAYAGHCENQHDKKKIWLKNALLISMLPVRQGDSAFLKSRLLNLIHDELNNFENEEDKTVTCHTVTPLPEKLIQTQLSVAQLGLFTRLLVEADIIKSDNQALLLRWMASSFKTSKTTAISAESLRVKYYATDPASVNIVREYVFRMINQLKKCS